MSHVTFKKNVVLHVSLLPNLLYPLSTLKVIHEASHYVWQAYFCVDKGPCRMWNLKNVHVAVSDLVVHTHKV